MFDFWSQQQGVTQRDPVWLATGEQRVTSTGPAAARRAEAPEWTMLCAE